MRVYSSMRGQKKIINNLSDQKLIDKYKVQVRDGIEGISQKKLQEREAFNQQLEKQIVIF